MAHRRKGVGLTRTWRFAWKGFSSLLRHPVFGVLTVVGNSVIFASAGALYFLESDINPALVKPMDALWWAVATVTTVGYGDIVPVTTAGRFVGMATMIVGTALFWSFTALFASVLLEREMEEVTKELEHELERQNSHTTHRSS